jgi:hypothetical protein
MLSIGSPQGRMIRGAKLKAAAEVSFNFSAVTRASVFVFYEHMSTSPTHPPRKNSWPSIHARPHAHKHARTQARTHTPHALTRTHHLQSHARTHARTHTQKLTQGGAHAPAHTPCPLTHSVCKWAWRVCHTRKH